MNWKLRLKNKATLTAIIAALVSMVYQILAALGIAPTLGQEEVLQVVSIVLTFLAAIGVLVDPTTEGLTDSTQALTYTEPKADDVECDRVTEDRTGE